MQNSIVLRGFLCSLFFGAVSVTGQEEAYICGTDLSEEAALLKRSSRDTVGGTIHVLTLRADFLDTPYDNLVTEEEFNEVNTDVSQYMMENSKGILNMTFSIHPTIFTYPGTAEEAGENFSDFQNWLDDQVEAAGLVRGEHWDRWIVNFPQIGVGWSGLSRGSRSGSNYTNGRYSSGLVAHELGHAIGLPHATALEAGTEVVGSFDPNMEEEERVEYGDRFDVMGGGGITGDYNTKYKLDLGWVDEGIEVMDVTASGTYRIYAHDNPERSGEVLALRIQSGDPDLTYWVEYRTTYSSSGWASYNARQGVLVRLAGYWDERTSGRTTAILDMTPGSQEDEGYRSSDVNDAALEVGETYTDEFGGFTITTMAVNDGVWDHNGWTEVQLNMGGTPVKHRLERKTLSFKGTPWEAGYKVYDLNSREIPRSESLRRGVYLIAPHGKLAGTASSRLYYQE